MKLLSITLAVCLLVAINVTTAAAQQDQARKFDEFTGANWESAMAHLDNFAVTLQNEPTALGVVIVYGGQRHRPLEAKAWSSCLKDYLLKRRSIDPTRVRFLQGGYRDNLTVELWMVPAGQQIPAATPTIKSSGVRFSGRKITKWRRLCAL